MITRLGLGLKIMHHYIHSTKIGKIISMEWCPEFEGKSWGLEEKEYLSNKNISDTD